MAATRPNCSVRRKHAVLLFAGILCLGALPASADNTAYVPTESGIAVLDTTTKTMTGSIPLPQWSGEMVLSPDGKFAYISNPLEANNGVGNTVEVISMATNTEVANIAVGAQPQGIAITPNGKFLYVTNSGWDSVWVIATATNTVVATITTGEGPYGVAITPDGAYAYVTNLLAQSASVINTTTNTVVKTIPLSARPWDIVISADGTRAYVAGTSSGNIFVIDTATQTLINTIPMTYSTSGVAITPDGRYLYTSTGTIYTGFSIAVIDTTNNVVVDNIPEQGAYDAQLAISPDGTYVYVSDNPYSDVGTVTVISTATNTVVASIDTGITTGNVLFTPNANQQIAVSSISLNPSTVDAGSSSTGTVILTGVAPVGGASVRLISNNPSVVVPASVAIAAGSTIANFTITTSKVAAKTSATVTATYGSTIKTVQLTIQPVGQVNLSSVSVNSVTGGLKTTGTVTLTAPAPTGGVVISLWTNGSPAFVPASVKIPAGKDTATFPVTTSEVTTATEDTTTAFYKGVTKTAPISVTPAAALSSVSVQAQKIGGGLTAIGTVNLSEPAPTGGITVYLWTNGSPAFVPTSVKVPAGALAATFLVTTISVSSPTQGTVTAFYDGMTETTTVTVTP